MKKINVLIIDDHSIIKPGIINKVKQAFEQVECHFTGSVRTATAIVHQHAVDILISDLELGMDEDFDGFYLIQNLKKLRPCLKCIAFTNYNSYRIMKKAESVGFNSFLDKSCSEDDFINTLQQVYNNPSDQVFYSQSMKDLLKKRNVFYRNIFTASLYGLSDLSDREAELTLLSAKTTDKHKLAEIMQIHHTTIDTHFKHALSKLQLSHRKELALFAEEFADEIKKIMNK
ncbi:MAG: response regulator [Bacteroidales bacterium]|jgi:DNA-binding NarL/FixJ family response regulator